MTTELQASQKSIYDTDFVGWVETTVEQLRTQDYANVDWENLIEEIEDMGKSEKRAIYSNLKILLLHLLKYRYQPEKRSNSWLASMVEHRQRIKKAFKESPSLQPYFTEIFNECYQDARELAAAETGMAIDEFPAETPFTHEEVLNSDYLPNGET
ncbi:MAG TPA: DUF29 domain-containing protein [Cyanobacteria bacterium UBA11372]|nr:DUF29 domain-containing protein [Cyanobacteria bacterium UBA11372]HBE47334.1 DUF29 domain-containing protein [Cyanobacteria bacterium UBA11369]